MRSRSWPRPHRGIMRIAERLSWTKPSTGHWNRPRDGPNCWKRVSICSDILPKFWPRRNAQNGQRLVHAAVWLLAEVCRGTGTEQLLFLNQIPIEIYFQLQTDWPENAAKDDGSTGWKRKRRWSWMTPRARLGKMRKKFHTGTFMNRQKNNFEWISHTYFLLIFV